MLVAGVIAIPVLEELTIRGFMFRGWSETRLGPIGTILLTSAIWCIIHRYGWLESLHLFLLGLALGYCRWRSNSTCLTVMMHSAFNSALFFMMGPSA
jgi:membrane protease YdiL (CAAX protease family)